MQRIASIAKSSINNTANTAAKSVSNGGWHQPISPVIKMHTFLVAVPDRADSKRLAMHKEHQAGLQAAVVNGHIIAHGRLLKIDPSSIQASESRRQRRLAASHIAEGNVSGSWLLIRAQSVQDVYSKLADDKMGREWDLERVSVQATEIDA